MKRIPVFAAFFSLVLLMAANAADGPDANQQQERVLAVLKEVQDQQIAIAANQVKIETRLATIAEALRIARINSSRGGR